MNGSRLPWAASTHLLLARYVPGLYVGTPRRNTLLLVTYLLVVLTLASLV